MTKIRNFFLLFCVVAMLQGCCRTIPFPVTGAGLGMLFTNSKEQSVAVKNNVNNLQDAREGDACIHNVLGLVIWGDASVEAAMKKSGIKDVKSVRVEKLGIFYFYANSCTVISGN